ncbi:hypothetical protein [Maribacter sp.]|uniref:hypothetical protein n=1 Tax=Maribacter sp. TaxID=1897614 RepID=UPI0025C5BA18|nr:hypothetical protein [Maribacter sp.]
MNIKTSVIKNCITFLFLFFITAGSYAQLIDLHYLPPLRQKAADMNNQAVYLSTPESISFDVYIYQGTSTVPDIVSVSNSNPFVYPLPNGNNDITMINATNVGIVLSDSGLRFEASEGEKFYVNYRGRSGSQATSLTSKVRAVAGNSFKWDDINNSTSNKRLNVPFGKMAVEHKISVTKYENNIFQKYKNFKHSGKT